MAVTATPQRPAAGTPGADPLLSGLELDFLAIIQRLHTRNLGHRVEKAGYLALGMLSSGGPARVSDLAARLELDVSTVSRQMKVLGELGLVERTADPDDGRASVVALSELGASELGAMRAARQASLRAALDTWDEADVTTLATLLSRLADGLDTRRAGTDPTSTAASPTARRKDAAR